MIHLTRAATAAAIVVLAGSLQAQLKKGADAPAFTIEKAWNEGPTDFSEFAGKLVILDFAQTW